MVIFFPEIRKNIVFSRRNSSWLTSVSMVMSLILYDL